MIAVSDSSPLILFAKVQQLDILRDLFTTVIVPVAVRNEIAAGGVGRREVIALADASWIEVRRIANPVAVERLLGTLGPGESEAIVLAQEVMQPAVILVDDMAARRLATEYVLARKRRRLGPRQGPRLHTIRTTALG